MNLELYHRETCPYSKKVRDFIQAEGLKSAIVYKETDSSAENKKVLMDRTDDTQVPCLMIDGEPLLESDDIIEYLKEHKGEITAH